MSEKNVKFLRGQVRQVVQSLLPEVFNAETTKAMEKVLITRMDSRLSDLTNKIETALKTMDDRSKDIQQYVVRNTGVPEAPTENKT